MKKVYISLYSKKGDKLISAMGFINVETKTVYIPKISKKGTAYIDEIVVDYLEVSTNGYLATEIVYIDDKVFSNTYYLSFPNDKKGAK